MHCSTLPISIAIHCSTLQLRAIAKRNVFLESRLEHTMNIQRIILYYMIKASRSLSTTDPLVQDDLAIYSCHSQIVPWQQVQLGNSRDIDTHTPGKLYYTTLSALVFNQSIFASFNMMSLTSKLHRPLPTGSHKRPLKMTN